MPYPHGDRNSGLRVVAIGGGTGLSTLLRGLKTCTSNITAVVTVSDDGGGSGALRNDLGILPPGDIRHCVLALANTEPMMEKLLNYRFPEGLMAGQSFGNLFLAALTGLTGSFDEAVRHLSDVLAVTGRVLPVTVENVYLVAEFVNGRKVLGESKISAFKKEQKCAIRRVSLTPSAPAAHPEVLAAVASADLIVLGPGSLYTSVIPNLLVEGVAEAIAASPALKVYICNLMTQEGETEGYSAYDHCQALLDHAPPECLGVCVASTSDIPSALLERYAAESAAVTRVDEELFAGAGVELIRCDLARFDDGVVRHHPLKMTLRLLRLLRDRRPRAGFLDDTDASLIRWLEDTLDEENAMRSRRKTESG
ncbi:MAG: YvcK family protein [Oscillospiraceae bacterium]|nr:YvcK family protein [Oscillospiraceae bacterium]